MKIKTMPSFAVLLALSSLMAPERLEPVQQCEYQFKVVSLGPPGNYVLMRTDPGHTYKLEGGIAK